MIDHKDWTTNRKHYGKHLWSESKNGCTSNMAILPDRWSDSARRQPVSQGHEVILWCSMHQRRSLRSGATRCTKPCACSQRSLSRKEGTCKAQSSLPPEIRTPQVGPPTRVFDAEAASLYDPTMSSKTGLPVRQCQATIYAWNSTMRVVCRHLSGFLWHWAIMKQPETNLQRRQNQPICDESSLHPGPCPALSFSDAASVGDWVHSQIPPDLFSERLLKHLL